jgi:predicted ribosome quality control (RQC) complex YloA/Tae2 family protein
VSAWDAKVNRVDQPEPGLLSFTVHTEGRTETLILSTLPGALDLAILEVRPRGAHASQSISNLRRHVEGARIVDVERSRRAIRVVLSRGDERRALVVTAAKPAGTWWLIDPNDDVILRSPGAAYRPPSEEGHWVHQPAAPLRSVGDSTLEAHRAARLQQLRRALGRDLKRARNKRNAIARDLEKANEASTMQEWASLLLAHAHEVPAGAEWFDAPSFEAPNERVRIPLSPNRSAAEEAQALFAKAKRLKRGLAVVPDRLEAVDQRVAALEMLERELATSSPQAAIERLTELGVSIEEPHERERKKRHGGGRLPYREFVTEEGASVLVGRGAADNDRLTLRVARPHDLWLHARGVTGAHVVVRLDKGQACAPEVLVDAATLSAHFSDLRSEAVVDVLYTPRRFVRKPKGSPVGSVTLEREKVIAVRLEPSRLARLLRAERKATP